MKSHRTSRRVQRGRARDAAASRLLRTLFWVIIAVGLLLWFKLSE